MKNIFLDTNVIIDFLADRQPFSESTAEIFSLADRGKVRIYVSAITFNNVYFIIRKVSSHRNAIQLISQLESLVEIIEVNKTIIKNAIISEFDDFEDAIQHECALSVNKIEAIITRNLKNFKRSKLPFFSSHTAMAILKNHVSG